MKTQHEKTMHPTKKTNVELIAKIHEALTVDCGEMIGDLTMSDAEKVEDILTILGFKTIIETETVGGRHVDSEDWVLVRYMQSNNDSER